MKKKILIIIMFLCLILLSSCETKTENETPDANKESYELAQKAGYTDSYTKWCELINGVEASQIKEVNLYSNGELTVTLENDKIIKLISIDEDIIPSYQGMSAEKIETKRNARRNANKFKSAVDDFLEIETSNKIEFFTSKNETFNIIVHLYNPKSYEILSFTLNGIKYQSYEFLEGSNSSKLIINVTSPNNPGLCEYTIDAIKYIDGSTIKDVSMDGEKTIKVGVKYDNLPSCKLLNESITIDTINLSVEIHDDNNLINTKNGLYFFLFDGIRIIESQKLSIGVNNIKYNLLQMSTNYEYMIISVYDDYSGSGLRSVSLYEGSFKSIDGVTINPSIITDNTLTVETTKYNNSIKIKEINLYNGDELVNTSNLDTTLFKSLLSNHDYVIEVVYTYLLNNVITSKVTKEVKTLSKTNPSVEFGSLDVSKNSINYQLKINDPSNTIVKKEIKLIKNNQVYQTKTQDKGTFTSLLSDNDYIVKIIYTYDLNEDGNIKEETLETKVHTQKNTVPTIVIKNVNTTSSNVTFKYEVLSDVTTNISSIELRKNDVVVEALTTYISLEFKNLLSNNDYVIRINYSYDLNDGNGIIRNSQEVSIKTKKIDEPTLQISTSISSNSINIQTLITNQSYVTNILDPVIDDTTVSVTRIDDNNYLLENAKSNHTYKISITYMYDLHDGLGVQTKTNECSVTTSKQVPSISFIPYNISQTSVEYSLLISDNNVTGRVNLITLYDGVTFVKRLNNLDTKITDLNTNTTYTAKINYVYDFDDGFGSREINEKYEFTTLKKDATYSLTFNDIDKQGFSLTHNLIDEDNVCNFKEINIYQDNTLVKKVTNKLETKVLNLLSDTLYKVVVLFDKNLNNGMETSSYTYYVTTEKYQTPKVNINLTSTKTSISYDYEIIDNEGISSFNSASIYYNGQKVDIISDKNVFSNLFSDSLYTIKISLFCDYHNGKEKQVVEYTKQIKTLPVDDISFKIEVTPQKRKIIYNHSVIDVDNIMSVKEVRLYRGNTLISTNYSLDNKVFENLYSNTVYKIVYVIEKDLNNNSDKVIVEFSQEVITLPLDSPTLDLDLASTIDTINYEFKIVDNDSTLILEKLLVYKNNQLIKTITDFTDKTITDLESNITYSIVFTYKYDLNDLQGLSSGEITKQYTTLASEVEVTKVCLLNSVNPKTNQNVNLNIKLNNPSKINITYVYVNNEKLTVNGGDGINNVIVTLKTQRMSGDMEVVVKRLGYVINDVTIEQAITKNNNLTLKVFSRLDIVEINLVNGKEVDKANQSFGYVVTIDNPNNYIVKEIVLDGDTETVFSQNDSSLVMIDNNHFYINDIRISNNYFIIKSIVYVDSDNVETIRNYTDSVEVNSTTIVPDNETNALIIYQISTPEEFMNMKEYLAYELINDIDMTGYNWKCKSFHGYFNGNGYKVKNLSYVHEDEWEFDDVKNRELLNLFNFYGNFTFKNVYFENIYVDINTTCLETLKPWESYKNREGYTHLFSYYSYYETETTNFKNVSLSGYVNIKSGEEMVGGFELYNDSIYIVDHLIVNNEPYTGNNLISYETFNSEEFRENTLNWNFVERAYDNYEGIDYYIVDNSYIIIDGYSGTSSDLVIPDTINGLPVIGINDLAFVNNLTIKSVQLPNSLCYVGASIFSGCSSLEKLIYPNIDIRSVGGLFGGKEYNGSYYTSTGYSIPLKLSHLELGSKSGIIVDYQCSQFTSLETLIIKEGVTSLNSYSFNSCASLTNIVLPNTLETIGNYAFQTCLNLRSIVIPKSVTIISSYAFNNLSDLIMYCEAESKPDGWNIDFESLNITVIYGYKK